MRIERRCENLAAPRVEQVSGCRETSSPRAANYHPTLRCACRHDDEGPAVGIVRNTQDGGLACAPPGENLGPQKPCLPLALERERDTTLLTTRDDL